MKRELLSTKAFKHLLALAIVLLFSTSSALAGEGYYDFFATLKAYPSGAGKVYADATESNISKKQSGEAFSENMGIPSDEVEVKFMCQYLNESFFKAYAIPVDGWILAGFSGCKKDQDDNHIFNDSIVSRDNPASLNLIAHISNEDQGTAEESFPLVADTTLYALFTHVANKVCEGQDSLGTVSISKVCNDIGDQVKLTATVKDPTHTKFDYWIKKETGEHLTDNPLNLTVSECAHYEAHFTSDLADVINFPEEGGLAIYYSDHSVSIPTNVQILTFNYSEYAETPYIKKDTDSDKYYMTADTASYSAYAKEPYILLGKGEATLYHTGEETSEYSTSYFKMTGDEAVSVSTLAATSHYYTVNLDKQQFDLLADDATIPAKTAYWALPTERLEALEITSAPSVIYWNNPSATTGINKVSKENTIKASRKGIYNLQGQKVTQMSAKGLYIINGKKVINLAK